MITHEKETPSRCPFVRSGRIGLSNSSPLDYSGQGGYGWSSIPYSSGGSAYYLGFVVSSVTPTNILSRHVGIPLRCLAS